MRQRLALAAAQLRAPRLLILDEPTAGLDPAGVRDLRHVLTGMAARGCGVLLSSHDMADVELVCDTVTILQSGRVVVTDSLSTLRAGSASTHFRLSCTDNELALSLAAGRSDLSVQALDGELSASATSEALASWLLSMAAAGVTPTELVRTGSELESLFLRLTGSQPCLTGAQP
jgi:ABC-2 type transport system ATP-binding protein